jgi:hypothetical protein
LLLWDRGSKEIGELDDSAWGLPFREFGAGHIVSMDDWPEELEQHLLLLFVRALPGSLPFPLFGNRRRGPRCLHQLL